MICIVLFTITTKPASQDIDGRLISLEASIREIFTLLKLFIQQTENNFKAIDQRFEGIDQRLDGIDQRLAVVDQRLDGIDQRLDGID